MHIFTYCIITRINIYLYLHLHIHIPMRYWPLWKKSRVRQVALDLPSKDNFSRLLGVPQKS